MFQQSNHLYRSGQQLSPQSINRHSLYHVQSHPNEGHPVKSMGGSSYLISAVWVADSNIAHDCCQSCPSVI